MESRQLVDSSFGPVGKSKHQTTGGAVDFLERFRGYMELERNFSPGTIAEYTRDLRLFAGAASPHGGLDEARPAEVSTFLRLLREERGLGARSINRKIAVLKSFYRWMFSKGYVGQSPMEAFRSLKVPERLPIYLSQGEATRLLVHTRALGNSPRGRQIHAIVSMLYYTGMRVSELTGLNLQDVREGDGGRPVIRIRGKGDKERLVPLPPKAQEAYRLYLEVRPEALCPALFISLRTRQRLCREDINRSLKRLARAIKLTCRLSPHTLRHTFASHLIQADVDVTIVADLLGHASLNTTRVYVHTRMRDRERAVAALSA